MGLAPRQTIRLGTICRLRASVLKTKNPIAENEVETLKKENPTFRGVLVISSFKKRTIYFLPANATCFFTCANRFNVFVIHIKLKDRTTKSDFADIAIRSKVSSAIRLSY